MKVIKFFVYSACAASLVALGMYLYNSQKEQDDVKPIVTVPEEPLLVDINSTDSDLLAGVTAMDDVDGDLSDSIFVDKISKGENEGIGTFDVSYVAIDNHLNVGKGSRKLVYANYRPPHFSVKEPLETTSDLEMDLRSLITAEDVRDGDITPFIKMTGDGLGSDDLIPGNYEVTLEITNSMGDRTVLPVTVKVKSTANEEGPVIRLSDYVVYVPLNAEFSPSIYPQFIDNTRVVNGTEPQVNSEEETVNASAIEYTSNVDTSVPGTYQVNYKFTSIETGQTGTATLYVCVERGQ